MELTTEDRERIEQKINERCVDTGILMKGTIGYRAAFEVAEYCTRYEREQQQTLIEMIKADRSNAIELQEQEFNEEINKGREEALTYVLECIEKLNSLKK